MKKLLGIVGVGLLVAIGLETISPKFAGGVERHSQDANLDKPASPGADVCESPREMAVAKTGEKNEEAKTYALVHYSNSGCSANSSCVPLILIHGHNGSNETPWNQLPGFENVDNNWTPLLVYLSQGAAPSDLWNRLDVYIFRYLSDQGMSVGDIGKSLRQEMSHWPNYNAIIKNGHIILVAHSMGGLVARAFLEYAPPNEPAGSDITYALMTLATPHHGTPSANKLWRNWLADSFDPTAFPSPSFMLDIYDNYAWCKTFDSCSLSENPNLANRKDLLWDGWIPMFADAKLSLSNKLSEDNSFLFDRKSSLIARKVIAYGGYLDPQTRSRPVSNAVFIDKLRWATNWFVGNPGSDVSHQHELLEAASGVMREKLRVLIGNDGLVPLDSALWTGNHMVAARRTFLDYDHLDMLGNSYELDSRSSTNAHLFSAVSADLSRTLDFQGVPLELLAFTALPNPVVSGTQVRLTYQIRNNNDRVMRARLPVWLTFQGSQPICESVVADIPIGDSETSRNWLLSARSNEVEGIFEGAVWPESVTSPCTYTAYQGANEFLRRQATVRVLPSTHFSQLPSISLALQNPSQTDYRIGEAVQLILTTSTGVPVSSVTPEPMVSIFIWRDGPDGRRFITDDGHGGLAETTQASPVNSPMLLVDYEISLPPILVTPGVPQEGTYNWSAAIASSEMFASQNLLAQSNTINYRILATRTVDPSVMSIATSLARYLAGDTMVIEYSTTAGTVIRTCDLMLRLTSQASGREYYFYDDSTDYNRWIHINPNPMWTGTAADGKFQIPTETMPPILIEDSTPSGTYAMRAYFSERGMNQQVGYAAESTFMLETPTPEGGCFIATAAWGSPLAPSVSNLRTFRDKYLLVTSWGKRFVSFYYRVGPRFAAFISPRPALRKLARIALWPVAGYAFVALHISIWAASLLSLLLVCGSYIIFRKAPRAVRVIMLILVLAAAASAADLNGIVVRSKPFPTPISGVRLDLNPVGQSAVSASDGSFRFQSLNPGNYTLKASLPGFLPASTDLVVTSSNTKRITIPLQPVSNRSYVYYMAHTAESDGWWTFFTLLNPNSTAADVIMEAFTADGRYLGVSADISRLNINQQISGAPSDFFPSDIVASAAWYRFTSISPLTGFELFGHASGAISGVPLTTADSNELYLPHIAEDTVWWTGLTGVSAGVRSVQFHVEARGGQGNLLVESANVTTLRPNQKTVAMISQYFDWDYPLDIQWAKLRSEGSITGFEVFATKDMLTMGAVPALSRGYRQFWFPHVPTTDGWWTGFTLLNVSSGVGIIRMSAYDRNGTKVASSRDVALKPGEKTVGLPQNYFNSFPSTTSYIQIDSDVDVTGFELVGRFTHSLLGGLPALAESGSQLAFPLAISSSDWDTDISVINTSGSSAIAEFRAMDYSGVSLLSQSYSIPPKGSLSGSLKSIFGPVPSSTRWVKVVSNGPALLGFLKLYVVGSGQFSDIAAVPLVAPEAVGPDSAAKKPDLVVTSFTAPRAVTVGGTMSGTSMTVANQGTADAGPFRVGFYLSTSSTVTTSSIFTTWSCTNSGGLSAGSTWNCSGNIGIPSSVSPGTYYLGAIVDDLGQVSESNENNNVRLSDSGTVTISAAAKPDLIVTSFTAPRAATVGGMLNGMSMTVANQGTADAGPFRVGFYLSTSSTMTTSSIFTTWSCTNSSGLSAGSMWNCSGNIGIPTGVSPGTYYLGAIVDDLGQVSESNESNNVRLSDSGTVTISVGAMPAPIITSFTAPRAATVGGMLSGMSMTVANQGTADAGPFRVGFYLAKRSVPEVRQNPIVNHA